MSLEFVVSDEGEFLRFTVTGVFSLAGIKRVVEGMRAATEGAPRRIVLHMTDIEGEFDNLTRFQAGELVAQHLKGQRILVVTQKNRINRLAENTAVNRGADLFVTHDENEGMIWLMEKP